MPSQLYTNEDVQFICARNFTYNGKDYKIGSEFPEEDLVTNVETLVRVRYLIPVVEDSTVKPRHWHREVRIKSDVLQKLGVSEAPSPAADDAFDPSEHNMDEVLEYLTGDISHEEYNRVIALEEEGKARKGILSIAEPIDVPEDETVEEPEDSEETQESDDE